VVFRWAQVWAEMADGSCRWRQTGSEVKVIALRVPADTPPADIAVDFDPYHLRGTTFEVSTVNVLRPYHEFHCPTSTHVTMVRAKCCFLTMTLTLKGTALNHLPCHPRGDCRLST